MPDGVDAAVDRMQAARGQPVSNRTPSDPELKQLLPGHHSVLALREPSHRSVAVGATTPRHHTTRGTFGPDMGLNGAFVRHGANGGAHIRASDARSVANHSTT
jgi:hypothetical protein